MAMTLPGSSMTGRSAGGPRRIESVIARQVDGILVVAARDDFSSAPGFPSKFPPTVLVDRAFGQQPLLRPQEKHEYSSGTAIATPVGTMRGSYQMVAEDGVAFEAPIPEFTLSVPRVLH